MTAAPLRWRSAVTRVLLRPRLLVLLWLLSLGSAAVATIPTGLTLYTTLADRPAVVKLARGQADALRSELFSVDGGVSAFLPMLLSGVLLGIVLFWLLQALLSGGIVAALLRPGHPAHAPPGRVLMRAVETAASMLRLELFGLFALRLPLGILVGAAVYLIARRPDLMELSPSGLALRFGPLVLLFAWLWSSTGVVMHYARIVRLTTPDGISSATSLHRALALTTTNWHSLGVTLVLGWISLVGYALLIGLGHLAAAALDHALFVSSAFVVRQVFALLRAFLALSIIAGATEVWHDLAGQLPARTPSSGL